MQRLPTMQQFFGEISHTKRYNYIPCLPRGTSLSMSDHHLKTPSSQCVSDHQRYHQNIYPSDLLVSMCYQMSENRCQARLYLRISYQTVQNAKYHMPKKDIVIFDYCLMKTKISQRIMLTYSKQDN